MLNTLKGKILSRILLLIIVGVAAIGIVGCVLNFTSSNETLQETMTVIAEQCDARINARLTQTKYVLAEIGMDSRFSDPNVTKDERTAILKSRESMYGANSSGYVNSAGMSDSGIDFANNASLSTTFNRAMAGETFFTAPTEQYGDWTVYVFAPVRQDGMDNGAVVGVVYLGFGGDFLSNIVADIRVGDTGVTALLDGSGTIIGHADHSLVTSQVNYIKSSDSAHKDVADLQSRALKHFETSQDIFFEKYKDSGVSKFGAFTEIDGTDNWMLVLTTGANEWLQGTYTAIIITVVLAVAAVIVGAAICIATANSIVNPIKKIVAVMNEVADGRLNVNIDHQSKDETGQLARSINSTVGALNGYTTEISRICQELSAGNFNVHRQVEFHGDFTQIIDALDSLSDNLSDTMEHIDIAAAQVSQGATQISDGATSLASGTTEQASSIQELASIISTLNDKVAANAANAADASSKAEVAGEKIEQSNQHMGEMVGAMNHISEKSNEISNIIKTIEDISFQTNILALNAAIEAARAGASGKGFAVVADEVRNLAGKSAEAAQSTTDLIQQTINAVGNGSKIANETAEALNASVEVTRQIVTLIEGISAASKEQATMIEQVNVGVDQISSVVQTNAATAEQSAASSEELNGQAAELQALTQKFVLKK
ncbi:MAG: methyl-accepting chemotaxis protein [Lachnospiraceae bacterium]|nr:methyl-accepting chemotaxis protein [Ruminococcus sp.]MCM1275630.1 methyl-accepting chemotaxis protein [Lachnospiraceae bacterium]